MAAVPTICTGLIQIKRKGTEFEILTEMSKTHGL
jgi:hypothetical protein